MFYGRSWDEWISAYERSHQHPLNRRCHALGIPLLLVSLPVLLAGIWSPICLRIGGALFVLGWILQFAGHMVEGQPPEFFRDWRFLLVGARWWLVTIAKR
jgi:uncharacterized membrane protein YGL010W